MKISNQPMHRVAVPQMPSRIQAYDQGPYRDEVVATYVSSQLGMVSQVIRRFGNGTVSLLNVAVGSGFLLARYTLSRKEVVTLRKLLAA